MTDKTEFIAIIPARYASTRFPGKPLVELNGKIMIQRVYEQASKVFENVCVATDDERISKAVKTFKGNVVMTSESHRSGTDRCAEAVAKIEAQNNTRYDVVFNIQGDEPFIQPEQLNKLKRSFSDPQTEIATLVKPITDNEQIFNPNLPKVVFDVKQRAIYFSRSPIPYIRDRDKKEWHTSHQFYRHLGLYAYRKKTLLEITKLLPSSLEIAESLEQNRWIESGHFIKVEKTELETIGIDTPADLEKAVAWMKNVMNNI